MIVIIKRKGETKDTFFKKFTRMFKGEDIIYEVNKKLYFKKPSLLKKEKMKERMKRKARDKKRFL